MTLTPYGEILFGIAEENADIARRQAFEQDAPESQEMEA